MGVIAERQKHIRIADTSRFHWRTVDALKAGGLRMSEEEKKRVKEAERDLADQFSERKRPVNQGRLQQPTPQQFLPQWQQPQWQPPPPQLISVPPRFQPRQQLRFHRPPGPCFNCYEMGHLKANCPKLGRSQYPFGSDNNVDLYVSNPSLCVNNKDQQYVTGGEVCGTPYNVQADAACHSNFPCLEKAPGGPSPVSFGQGVDLVSSINRPNGKASAWKP